MRVQVVTVNHGTTPYADLLLRSLVAHHEDRSAIDVLLLNNGPDDDLGRLDWSKQYGVRIRPSGYPLEAEVTTHGEVLRDAVLAEPDCDAYLFVDSDVCFTSDNTIGVMADELTADPELFAVQAMWGTAEGTEYDAAVSPIDITSRIREAVLFPDQTEWPEPYEYETGYGDRVHPFCVLVRNDRAFRTTVEVLGLSPGGTQCVRGAVWFDTLGILTQVMKTHGKTWRKSSRSVLHFASVSWRSEQDALHAGHRDAMLEKYPLERLF